MKLLEGRVALVVGAGRGLGRGIAEAFIDAGATVVAIARSPAQLATLSGPQGHVNVIAADATDPVVAGNVLAQWRPQILALEIGRAHV